MGSRYLRAALLTLGVLGFSVGTGREIAVDAAQNRGLPVASSLTGTIQAADGKALEGVTVSARAFDKAITVTVFTDERGDYLFPALENGRYRVWAQAVGYRIARADITLDAMRQTHQSFTLNSIDDFTLHVSASEWRDALPVDTKEDRRMKEIFSVNCTACHLPSVALRNRFDERGWLIALELMLRQAPVNGTANRHTTIDYHKVELARYLARVRGPESRPLKFKLHPRPTGDAARVVITEYDIPVPSLPGELAWHNGSDWSEGASTGMHGAVGVHDVIIDNTGNAWLTENGYSLDRTITKLNPQTGDVTAFKLPGRDGVTARRSHGIGRDQKGILWFDTGGDLGRIDPATDTVELFTPPPNMGNGVTITVDSDGQGKIWAATRYGAIRFDPDTKKWKHLQNVTVADGLTYGMTGDAEGNGWWSQFNADRVVKGDPRTGKTYEVVMRPPWLDHQEDVTTPADRDFYESVGALSWGRINTVPGAQAPRRLGADKNGNTVWVPNYLSNNLAKINIHTLETTYYPVPVKGNPYFSVVDRNHNVWTNLRSNDRVLKFNPETEQWTVYQLPSIGCESRNIAVDDIRCDVWLPCFRTSRVVRLQFRTAAQLHALRSAGAIHDSIAVTFRPNRSVATEVTGSNFRQLVSRRRE